MDSPTEYVTVVEPVLEVTLRASADSAPWRDTLAYEGITFPQNQERIEIILSAAEMKYWGVKFQELSISLRIDETQAFLVYAFNSNRIFAFVERAMFHTPYYFATLRVGSHHIQLRDGEHTLLEATLPQTAAVTHSAAERDDFQIWLPSEGGQVGKKARYFNARLEGETVHYAVVAESPTLMMATDLPIPLQALRDSNLRIEQWTVRDRARHSKSRTFTTQR